jgi:serine/threonine-protein kinase
MTAIDPGSATRAASEIGLPARYRLLHHIANGGMAAVWCAHDSVLSRKIAVKVLAPQFQHDPLAVRRFAREARAAARLSGHRNIVTIYDVGDALHPSRDAAAGPAFIVMEFLSNGTVAHDLRAGAVSPDTGRRWIHEAAAALDYAHARGVVHGDIKPGNLLLDSGRVVHMADFGIARIASEDTITSTGQLFGTAAYLSPEQALGDRATAASDRYALAVVAFELLAGEKPFRAERLIEAARRHVDEQPPAASTRNPELPRTLDPVLQRGMAKRPERRWPTATAFADAIDAALQSRSVLFAKPRSAAFVSSWAPPPRRRARRSHMGALAALAAVAVLAGVVFGASDQQGAQRPRVIAGSSARAATPSSPQSKAPAKAPATRPTRPTRPTMTPVEPTPPASTAPPPPTSAASLEAQGHSMIAAGNYAAAVPVLERAMRSAPLGGVLYQWSLFDLGHAYREMGDLAAAIPLLQERLRYSDQRPVVQQELNAALSMYNAQTAPAPPKKHGDHGKHHGQGD